MFAKMGWITLKYLLFAVIATLVNLGAQELIDQLGFALWVAMAAGTLLGLVVKFYLDKHFIFGAHTVKPRQNLSAFIRYGLLGAFCTLIFFGFELSFDYFFGNKVGRYVGAILGLSIGYSVKYHLDKRLVFNHSHPPLPS
jgi:putative flippase GtrA